MHGMRALGAAGGFVGENVQEMIQNIRTPSMFHIVHSVKEALICVES